MAQEKQTLPPCAVCKEPAPLKCGACLRISYCSQGHQQQDWKAHRKRDCKLYDLKDFEHQGKGLVATRDIKMGAIILEEEPVVRISPWAEHSWLPKTSCLTCGLVMGENEKRRCGTCTWPVCSAVCEKLPIHAENECRFLSERIHNPWNLTFPPPADIGVPPLKIDGLFMYIRVFLLRAREASKFAEILKLQSEWEVENKTISYTKELMLFKMILLHGHDSRSPEIRKLLHDLVKFTNVFQINGFRYRHHKLKKNRTRTYFGVNLYMDASRLNHSCSPNCCWEIGPSPDYKVRVRASVPIKKGEQLTINCLGEESFSGTRRRQEASRRRGFSCRCRLCLDPTEGNSFISGVTCQQCIQEMGGIGQTRGTWKKYSYLLPEQPLCPSSDARWKCTNEECGAFKRASEILPQLNRLADIMIRFRNDDQTMRGYRGGKANKAPKPNQTSLSCFQRLIDVYTEMILHPNHWLLQMAHHTIFKLLWRQYPDPHDIPRKELYLEQGIRVLNFINIFSPGLSKYRAAIQLPIAEALYLEAKDLILNREYPMALTRLAHCLQLQKEALAYRKTDFLTDEDGKETVEEITKNIQCTTMCHQDLFAMLLLNSTMAN